MEVMHQSYRFALDVTPEQDEFLNKCAGASRFWFNAGLALVKERLNEREQDESVRVPWSYISLCSAFKGDAIKDELAPWHKEVVCGSFQAGLEGVGKALQNFSKGRKQGRPVGFPKFRAKGRSHESILFQRPRFKDARHVMLDDRRLGPVRTRESMRKLFRLLNKDEHAQVLCSTVQRYQGGWVISVSVKRSLAQKRASRPVRQPSMIVGVDLGLSKLATLSTGAWVANTRPLRAALVDLKRFQRKLDKQRRTNNPGNYLPDGRIKPGRKEWVTSNRMLLTQKRVTRLHARVANLRKEQAHQLTTFLTREYGVIAVESLAVKNMLKNRSLARAISDVGWGLILQQLQHKTQWAGSRLLAADRFYPSSKTCSSCGSVKTKLSLSEREYSCEGCGLIMDRDWNAAVNLAQQALVQLEEEAAQQQQGNAKQQSRERCSVFQVALACRDTLNARGGYTRLNLMVQSPPMEESRETSSSPLKPCSPVEWTKQRGNTLALVA